MEELHGPRRVGDVEDRRRGSGLRCEARLLTKRDPRRRQGLEGPIPVDEKLADDGLREGPHEAIDVIMALCTDAMEPPAALTPLETGPGRSAQKPLAI